MYIFVGILRVAKYVMLRDGDARRRVTSSLFACPQCPNVSWASSVRQTRSARMKTLAASVDAAHAHHRSLRLAASVVRTRPFD